MITNKSRVALRDIPSLSQCVPTLAILTKRQILRIGSRRIEPIWPSCCEKLADKTRQYSLFLLGGKYLEMQKMDAMPVVKNTSWMLSLLALVLLVGCRGTPSPLDDSPSLLIYAGAASKPPTEELAAAFEAETGVKVSVIFGGSGYVLSQMKLSGKGDLFFPGSSDFMEIAKREGLVLPETEQRVVYLVNAINVQRGNPLGIRSLRDLCRPGIRLAIGQPDEVCVGAYAEEIIEANLSPTEQVQLRRNIVTYTESCDKTATVVALKTVDAVIGWRVFEYWNPDAIESIALHPDELLRIGYIPIAIATSCQQTTVAQRFIDYTLSDAGKAIFAKYHYLPTPEAALKVAGNRNLAIGNR